MKMEFTYDDFVNHYADDPSWLPLMPLEPWKCVDQSKFPSDAETIDLNIRKTMDALEKRMGGEYYSKFRRAQALSQGYGQKVFPAYGLLFLDVACEDWLSLVDFHKGFGRDHSVHQPLTAYIVSKLLGGGVPEKAFQISGVSILNKALDAITTGVDAKYLLDRLQHYDAGSPLLQGNSNRELWKQVFYQTAIITAMYHDLGYPWQFIERMHDFLKDDILLCGRLNLDDDPARINPVVNKYIDEHQEQLMFRPFYDYGRGGLTSANINRKVFEESLHSSHGVPGALAYWAYNNAFRLADGISTAGLIAFCQEWSSMAILNHDMLKAYKRGGSGYARLDFNADPLSFIIALADTLEDFNRPNATIKADDSINGCGIAYSFPSLSVELEETGGDAELRYQIVPEQKETQEKYKSDDQRDLFNQPNGYFSLPSIGLRSLTIKCK